MMRLLLLHAHAISGHHLLSTTRTSTQPTNHAFNANANNRRFLSSNTLQPNTRHHLRRSRPPFATAPVDVEPATDETPDEIPCPDCGEWIPVDAPTLVCDNCGWSGPSPLPTPEPVSPARASADDSLTALQQALLSLSAATSRGEWATDGEKAEARDLVSRIEAAALGSDPATSADCQGTWELIFSDTQLFRSSPFFMAGRAVCSTTDEARRYDAFCELHRAALAISSIRKVRQVVRLDAPARITSEFEVRAGAVPFLSDLLPGARYSGGMPVAIDGAIVTSASIESVDAEGWELYLDMVEVKGSNVPGLRQLLDGGLRLESRQLGNALESTLPNYSNPRPRFRTTFVDGSMRISRDQDGKLFVYTKVSEVSEPTDYSAVEADLGLGGLFRSLSALA